MYNKVRILASALIVVGFGAVGCKSKECAECSSGSQYGYSPTSASSYPSSGYPAPTTQPTYSSVPTTGGQMMPQTMPSTMMPGQ